MKSAEGIERPENEFEQRVSSAKTIEDLRELKAEVESRYVGKDLGLVLGKYTSEMRIIGLRAMHVFAQEAKSARTPKELDGIAKDAQDFYGEAGILDTGFLNPIYSIVDERIKYEKDRVSGADNS